MSWKSGPLPPDTYHWGGVVTKDSGNGFLFADFCGDHVKICPGGQIVKAEDVLLYDNGLELPPNKTGRSQEVGGA